jgi:hypothetical protein
MKGNMQEIDSPRPPETLEDGDRKTLLAVGKRRAEALGRLVGEDFRVLGVPLQVPTEGGGVQAAAGRDVVICAPHIGLADGWARALSGSARSVQVMSFGHIPENPSEPERKAFVAALDAAPPFEPARKTPEPETLSESAPRYMRTVRLGSLWRDGLEEVPFLLPGLMYSGCVHVWSAPPESGKTVLSCWAAKGLMEAGHKVALLDWENGPAHVAGLLVGALGMDPEVVDDRLIYAPSPDWRLEAGCVMEWEDFVLKERPALTIVDSLVDVYAQTGLNENDSVDAVRLEKAFFAPVKAAGGAVLLLDHTTKDGEGRGARGSSAKLGYPEVAWKLSKDKDFDPETVGGVVATREKDRLGRLPKRRRFAVGGDGGGRLVVTPKDPPAEGLKDKESDALAVLRDTLGGRATKADWKRAAVAAGVAGKTTFYEKTVPALLAAGYVEEREGFCSVRAGK